MIKKLLLGLCGLFAIVVLLLIFFGGGLINRGVREGVISYGPRLTQTSVELGEVDISPWSGRGTLRNLVVGNPEGFTGDYAIRLTEAAVAVEVGTVLKDPIVIERIYLSEPSISLERAHGTTNLQRIQRNIHEAIGAEEAEPTTDEPGRRFIVKEFVLEGGQVSLSALGAQTQVAMPSVRLEGIGERQGGVPAAEIGGAILDAVIRAAVGAAGQQATELLRDPQRAEETLRNASGALQRLLGRDPEE